MVCRVIGNISVYEWVFKSSCERLSEITHQITARAGNRYDGPI